MRSHGAVGAADFLRFYGSVISDEHLKQIHGNFDVGELAEEILNRGAPFNMRELETLIAAAGDMDGTAFNDMDDDTLQKYADHIHNYRYTYKPEAKAVDPNIDTSEEHNGPMAQDIEKVLPEAVVDDPKTGYKEISNEGVGRIALMNMGAIADLAREVQKIKEAINAT